MCFIAGAYRLHFTWFLFKILLVIWEILVAVFNTAVMDGLICPQCLYFHSKMADIVEAFSHNSSFILFSPSHLLHALPLPQTHRLDIKFTLMNYDVLWGMGFNHVFTNTLTITENYMKGVMWFFHLLITECQHIYSIPFSINFIMHVLYLGWVMLWDLSVLHQLEAHVWEII